MFWFSVVFGVLLNFYSISTQFEEVAIYFYFGTNITQFRIYPIKQIGNLTNDTDFNVNRSTVLYVHGYRENVNSESVQTVIKAFLMRDDNQNILVMNWSNYSDGNYATSAVPDLIKLGHLIGVGIYSFAIQNAFDPSRLHIVGHSLGAQLAGYIGRWIIVMSQSKLKVQRITGLDPARPLFSHKVTFMPTSLSSFDARFVDVIHTDSGNLGESENCGIVDFWPNGGSHQSGCKTFPQIQVCDHMRSWRYFAESVASKNSPRFDAIQCDTYKDFKKQNCSGTYANMGIDSIG
jgi:hypothetical protein